MDGGERSRSGFFLLTNSPLPRPFLSLTRPEFLLRPATSILSSFLGRRSRVRKIFAEGKSDRDVLLLSSFCVFSRPFELGVTLGSCPPNVGFCGLKIHASFPFPFFSSSFFFGESLLVRKTFVSGGSPPPPPTKPCRPTMGETGLILSPFSFLFLRSSQQTTATPSGPREWKGGGGRGKLFCVPPPFFFFFSSFSGVARFHSSIIRPDGGRRGGEKKAGGDASLIQRMQQKF